MASMMNGAERDRRRAEVYAARDEYERLRAAYERDVAPQDVWAASDLLDGSYREDVVSEQDFRRGYLHGAREAVDHFYEMMTGQRFSKSDAYTAMWNWHERAIARWFQAAQLGDASETPPPDPQPPERED